MSKRLNIGLFVDDMDAVFTKEACKGAEQGAIAIDANMFIFPGGYLDLPDHYSAHERYGYQYNSLFSFVNAKHIDILYIMLGMIGGRVPDAERRRFLERYLGIPVIILYTKMNGYHSITFDNRIGFLHAITHLIKDHHVTKIGYVSGPKTNTDAMERFDVYKTALSEADIPFRADYVTYGNFEETTEPKVFDLMTAHPELEAVVFANDRMAHGGYRAFQKLGLEVGKDVLVVSFDNSSFASTLTPPLSTVEANAAELSYYAVKNAESFIRHGFAEDNIQVNTHFIRRSSCGCTHAAYNVSEQLGNLEDLFEDKHIAMERILSYLFSTYIHSDELVRIKDDLSVLFRMLYEMTVKLTIEELHHDCKTLFIQIIEEQLLHYTTVEQFFNVLGILEHALLELLPNDSERLKLTGVFSTFYRNLAIMNRQYEQGQVEGMEQVGQIINSMIGSIFVTNNIDEIPYEAALSELAAVGIKRSYLYAFPHPIENTPHTVWEHPSKVLLKAYYDGEQAVNVPLSHQLMPTLQIFNNDTVQIEERHTMVLTPLFSGQYLYGLLLCQVDFEHAKNIAPIALQFSIALKSLALIESEHEAQKQLAQSLLKATEDNSVLDEISKSDELTGLYNRRGFLEYTKTALTTEKNNGKHCLVIYADMDNLKMINDKFGHDEGDFALKEIAAILRETFRNTDIIGRLGGDEFVVFALTNVANQENILKRRIQEITDRHNMTVSKPYPIIFSSGVYEFTCSPEIDIYDVLEKADAKLYEEKAAKKEMNGSYR